jgi:hypothetical protein
MPGIFCIEQEWNEPGFCKKRNALPVLRALQCGGVESAHITVRTIQGFYSSLDRWLDTFECPHLYLFFHGEPGEISVGDAPVSLVELARFIGGRGRGRHIHFGSCGTLNVDPKVLRIFIRRSGIFSISGYTRDVCTAEAAALEILFFEQLSRRKPRAAAPQSFAKIDALAPGLIDGLGFRVFTNQ